MSQCFLNSPLKKVFSLCIQYLGLIFPFFVRKEAGKKRTYRRRSKRRRRRRLIIFGEGVILGVTTTGFKTKLKAGEEGRGGDFLVFYRVK